MTAAAAPDTSERVSPFSERVLRTLRVPRHGHDCELEVVDEALRCRVTGETIPFVDGVPTLYRPEGLSAQEITTRVRAFYEENPFPSYEGMEEFGTLVNKGIKNPFTTSLLEAIGWNKLVLEVGCGTGQLSHFLQLNNNHTLGVDLCKNSLALAMEHKRRNRLVRSSYCQMDIFDLGLADEAFDVVIAHGCLHHTYDARRAFANVVKKARRGGIVVVGLYNSYARIPTWIRARLVGLLGPRIDYVVRTRIHDARKADIWIKDQYYNPHETWHSIDEVLRWFAEDGVEFLNCSPPIMETPGEEARDLFAACGPGSWLKRAATQVSWLTTIAREGALFDVIGRRR